MKEKRFVIMTDAGADYSPEIAEKYGLERQPKSMITWNDGSQREADIDWENITPNDFYFLMSNKKNNFSSSIPEASVIRERLTNYAKQGLDIIVLTIRSAMSGSYDEFYRIAFEVRKVYRDIKIAVIDTLRYGGAMTLLAIEASLYRKEGNDFDDTVEYLEETKKHVHQIGTLDDLFFLARKGRISRGKAFMGNLVGIKPMADFNNESGMSEVIGSAKGYQKFFKILPDYVLKTIGSYKDKVFVISHSFRDPQAKEMARIIKARFNPEELIMLPLGQATGANVGPGLAAVYYIGDAKVSPNCEKEREIINELLLQK